jgi:hypothetical protein
MFKKASIAVMTLIATATLMFSARPASAAHCGVLAVPGLTMFTCVLPANPSFHLIHVGSGSYVNVEVVDRDTLVTVFSERAGFWGLQKTITGLYGDEYYAAATHPQVPVMVTLSN